MNGEDVVRKTKTIGIILIGVFMFRLFLILVGFDRYIPYLDDAVYAVFDGIQFIYNKILSIVSPYLPF